MNTYSQAKGHKRKSPVDLREGHSPKRYKPKGNSREPGIRASDPTLKLYKRELRKNPEFCAQERFDDYSRYHKDPSKPRSKSLRWYHKHKAEINAKRKANNWGRK